VANLSTVYRDNINFFLSAAFPGVDMTDPIIVTTRNRFDESVLAKPN
jgi:hypothetical protein